MKMQNFPGTLLAVISAHGLINNVPGAPKGLNRLIENFNPKVLFGGTPGSMRFASVGKQL